MGYSHWVARGVLLVGLSGCGGEDGAAGPSGSAGTAGNAGTTTSGGGGSNSGGAGALAGSAPSGGATVAGGSCLRPYAAAVPVFTEDVLGIPINGISVTSDELELFYARTDSVDLDTPPRVVRRTRTSTSAMFGAAEPLSALDGVCGTRLRVNPDISEDGLTLYVTCTERLDDPDLPEGKSTLRVARRPDRASDFVLAPDPIGSVYASAGLSADQLTAYTDGEAAIDPPRMFVRMSEHENFNEVAQMVPGISTRLRSLDISASGLQLFGTATVMVGDAMVTGIQRFVRPSSDMPFGPPELLELGVPEPRPVIGAPNITPSCGLYIIVSRRDMPYAVFRAAPQ